MIAPGAEETGGAVVLHLTTVDEWSTALANGTYDRSTRGRGYAEVGGDGTRYPHLYGTVPCRLVRTVKRAAMDSGGRLHVMG